MKKLSALLCGLLMSALPATMHAQEKQYVIDKVTPAIVTTPQYNVGEQRPGGPTQPGKWLEVEVQFQAGPDVTDEMTFQYYIAIADKVLSGSVTHVNVLKGHELYSVIYVSPHTLATLLPANVPVTPNIVKLAGVQLLIKGQVIDEKDSKPGPLTQWSQYPQTAGMLLNKNQTPFAPLYWDRYEAIKLDK